MNKSLLGNSILFPIFLGAFLLYFVQTVFADTLSDSDLLFDWAESQYPQYFSPAGQNSQTFQVWYYRYYPDTDIYLGVNTVELDVNVLGDVFGGMKRVDTLEAMMVQARINSATDENPENMTSVSEPCPSVTNEAPQSPGPYDHNLGVATSSDGITFSGEKVSLLERASAPDSVVGPDGKVWVYYVNGTPGQHAIFIAKVQDDGSVLPFDCLRIDNKVDKEAVDPDVLRLSDGSYQLFFNPLVSPSGSEHEGIYIATSTDGIHFENKKQIIQQRSALNPSGVKLNDGSWLLTYTDETRTYIAKSTDGEQYSITTDFDSGIPELTYLPELDEARLYMAEISGLTLRTSTDGGTNWTQIDVTAPGVQDPSILRLSSDSWYLYYRFETQ